MFGLLGGHVVAQPVQLVLRRRRLQLELARGVGVRALRVNHLMLPV